MLRLVVFSTICLGFHNSLYVDASEKTRVIKDESSFRSNDVSSSFHCHKRAPGYYADPRFKCEVFHYCHTDGTRVTIPCSNGDQKHRICFLKDIASKACDGTELFLPLPEDLFFKPSKDTTASALNSATEFKLPEVLPEPAISSETSPSTTPLSSEDDRKDRDGSFLTSREVGGIFEVFNSFLKEIETRQDLDVISNSSSRPRPSTFSRRSRLPSSLEHKDALVDVSPRIEKRIDEEGPFLVEIYKDGRDSSDNDYSPYRRRSKKLFFSSDKKILPGKHPRKKRTVPVQQPIHRPYAIVYAKVPDTTMPESLSAFREVPKERQDSIELPFAPALVPGNVPVVPVTIETRRRKKNNENRNSSPTESVRASHSNGQQQTSEQQNIYYYAPDQNNGVHPQSPGIRTEVEPRQQLRGNADQGQSQNQRPHLIRQSNTQSHRPAPYSPQSTNRLQLPTFPFQPQQYINAPQQPPYFFGSQDGFQPFSPPFGLERPQLLVEQPPARQQRQRPPVQQQPPRTRQPERPSNSQIIEDQNKERTREERPTISNQQQGYSGFQHPFFNGFPGLGSSSFNSPFTQRDPSPFSLVPPSEISQQPPSLPDPQTQNVRYNDQGRPVYSAQEVPQSQPQSSYVRNEGLSSGIPIPVQPNNQDPTIYGRERTRHQSGNIQNLAVSQPQTPSRVNSRPLSPDPPTRIPEKTEEVLQLHPPRSLPSRPVPREREQPEQYSPYDSRLYQPGYSPENLIIRPERPSSVPIQNGIPREYGQTLSGPATVLVEDYRQGSRPRPQNTENDPREIKYIQRQPSPDRNIERTRQSERERGSSRPQPQSSYYHSPTTPPPSSRIRQSSRAREESRPPTRTREETRPPTRIREEIRPTTRTREETRAPARIREETRSPTRTREEPRVPSRTRERTRQSTRNERNRHRSRPVEETDVRNVIEELPEYGHRSSPPPDERQVNVRTIPIVSEIRPTEEEYYQRPPPSNIVNDIPNSYYTQSPPTTNSRYRENPRERPSQPQIERPPSDVSGHYQPNDYARPQGYYPANENYVNVISTVDDSESKPRTTPSVTVRRPSNRGSSARVRDSNSRRRPDAENGFRPMTQKPQIETYYHTRPSVNENIEIIEEYKAPENIEANRYQDLEELPPTTVQISTTQRPTTKRRPPPPRPTFPTFPTFPPPPRRPSTTPRTIAETSELRDETPVSFTKEPEHFSTSRNRIQEIDLENNESLRNKEHAAEDYVTSSTPEVTTRRRTRKRKQKPRRPRPTVSYSVDEHTSGDTVNKPTTDKEVTTQTTSGRSSRWRQQTSSNSRKPTTTTPVPEVVTVAASAKSEEFGSRINLFGRQRSRKPAALKPRTSSTTPTAPLLREESVRVSKVPTITRGKKQFTNKLRSRTTTTTTTANPDTEDPVARSDENVEFYNFQSIDTTTDQPSSPEYEHSTSWPMELTTEFVSTTESYNQMVETTPETTTPEFDEETDHPQNSNEKVGDFESTRSVVKKFQNRPRILKFGKPKLKTTISPIDLNVAESRYF
ncbi:proteoglycan 4-like [Argiope bruennichi]|uniref:proteoglycan 4-like n=1 Tax=Argiope bruennichi TaxID=94029 RepID=UPI00249594D9|nr:proteoglycan 4-like [Argiope bruennichi]